MDDIAHITQEFYKIKPYLYYDVDTSDPGTKILFERSNEDVVIMTNYAENLYDTKFCAKFDPYTKKFYGPVLVEHYDTLHSVDDYTGNESSAEEKTFIVGTLLKSKPVGLWTYSSLFYDDTKPPEYSIVAKVKYDDNGNVKKTKIWDFGFNVVGGEHDKPAVKTNGFHPLVDIFALS